MTSSKPARAGVWAQFFVIEPGAAPPPPAGGRASLYRVDAVEARLGQPLPGIAAGATLCRLESPAPITSPLPGAADGFAASGVVQHVLYTDAERRKSLAAASVGECGPRAVLIPIAKSDAWWAMAQDERERYFRRAPDRPGHVEIGARFAATIFRRLYQARYLPGSDWDFLTYFEMTAGDVPTFRTLLAELRDPSLNPEWRFVEREAEVWMTKMG